MKICSGLDTYRAEYIEGDGFLVEWRHKNLFEYEQKKIDTAAGYRTQRGGAFNTTTMNRLLDRAAA